MQPICQTSLPYDPFAPRPLPGIAPLDIADWIRVDDAYAGQMARRDALIATQYGKVIALDAPARPAADELLADIVTAIQGLSGFARMGDSIRRPDGTKVVIDTADPLATAGRLVQEDFCLMQKRDSDEHVMTGAVLCFPASWSLEQKFMRPLIGIHTPVESYDQNVAKRVQRLFDGVRAERPLWRFNALWYASPELHQPRKENQGRAERDTTEAAFLRSELQTIRRLRHTGAVVFGIHTFVVRRADLSLPADGASG